MIGVKDYLEPISYFTKVIENMKDYRNILEYDIGLYSKNLRKCYTTLDVTRSNHCFVYRLTSIAWQCKLDHSYTKNGESIMQTTSRTKFKKSSYFKFLSYTTLEVNRSNDCFVYRLTSVAWQCNSNHSFTKNSEKIMQITRKTRFKKSSLFKFL